MKAQIVAASLVGAVAASHLNAGHAGFHFRRNADNVCKSIKTVYTTVYVEAPTGPVPPPPASTNTTSTCTEAKVTSLPVPVTSSSSVKVASSSSASKVEVYSVPVVSVPVVSVPVVSVPVSSAPVVVSTPVYQAPSSSSAAPSSKPSSGGSSYGGSGGRVTTNGDKWAMTYTPYTKSGDCKSKDEVASDVKKIKGMGFTTLRVYSTDCNAFEYIAPACQENNLKFIVGVFFKDKNNGPFSDYANQQVEAIKSKAPKDLVTMVIVGNEALMNGYTDANTLGSYLDYVRKELRGAGFPTDIAITTTDTVDVWISQGAALCSHIDVFTVQVHPYFTSKVSPSQAGDFAMEQLDKAAAVCSEVAKKGAYISEIGWPHSGNTNGAAVPGVEEQKTAIASILEKVGSKSCLFSFQDDLWKAPGDYNVEQAFGCASAVY